LMTFVVATSGSAGDRMAALPGVAGCFGKESKRS